MSSPDATVSRLGQINGATGTWAADTALFLKVFGGEVLASFTKQTVTLDKHTVRTITSGRQICLWVKHVFNYWKLLYV
jgi:hypothetical protein